MGFPQYEHGDGAYAMIAMEHAVKRAFLAPSGRGEWDDLDAQNCDRFAEALLVNEPAAGRVGTPVSREEFKERMVDVLSRPYGEGDLRDLPNFSAAVERALMSPQVDAYCPVLQGGAKIMAIAHALRGRVQALTAAKTLRQEGVEAPEPEVNPELKAAVMALLKAVAPSVINADTRLVR